MIISPSSSSHTGYTLELTARLVLRANLFLANILLSDDPNEMENVRAKVGNG
jgi:hypothetical protein